jgi:hypothetical protein
LSPDARKFTEAIPGWIDKHVDQLTKGRANMMKALVKPLEHIPVVGKAAQAYAWFDNKVGEFGGGILKGAGSMVGGVLNMVTHPVETATGLFAMAEHVPVMNGLVPNPLKLAHAGADIIFNGADPKTRLETVIDPVKSLQDDGKFGKALVDGFIEPYKKAWSEGKYAEVAGRATFDIGSLFIGAGEANAAIKTGEVASVAGKTAEVANVAGKAEKATEAASLAEKAADAGTLAKGADELVKAEKATLKPGGLESKTKQTTPQANTPKIEADVPKAEKVETDVSSVKHPNQKIAETSHPEYAKASSREHAITSADVQPRHFTKLEHAIRFRQVGQPKRAASFLRELKTELGPKRYEMLRSQHLQDLDKGSALRGNVLKGDSYRASSEHLDLMRSDDKFSINAQKRERLEGYYDVIAHGVEESPGMPTTKIRLQTNGREVTIDHRVLAKLLKKQKGYDGERIRLLSCLSGNAPESFAQNLANKMKKEVLAPSDFIWAGPEGELPISSSKMVKDLSGKELPVPNRPFDGKWNTFEPQSSLEKPQKVHSPELERTLSKKEMAPSKLIPNDEILRAASPQEFIGGVAGYLGENYPLTRPHKIKMIETDAQRQKLQKAWKNKLESQGLDSKSAAYHSEPDPTAKGITYEGDIALMPETMKNIRSHRIEDRLTAMKTITHEWWHAMRSSKNRFAPFEEGAADLFSEMVVQKKIGIKADLRHSYEGLKRGVELLKSQLGDEWFFASRSASDSKQYLRETLSKAGYPHEKINLVLKEDIRVYGTSRYDDIWLERVQNLLSSKN